MLTVNVPVSKGGDSIGGSVLVTPREPVFAPVAALPVGAQAPSAASVPQAPLFTVSPGVVASGAVSTYFRSNGGGVGVAGNLSVATDHFSLNYDGGWSKSGNYTSGNGQQMLSTQYSAQNHAGTLAYRNEDQLVTFRYSYQWIPYQGFINQYMDMLGNNANTFDLSYKGGFGWGALEANAYYHLTQHYMNFLEDRTGTPSSPTSGMPMYVNGQDYGYRIKATINASPADLVRVGSELHMQTLNEWWPPVGGGSSSMSSGSSMGGSSMSMGSSTGSSMGGMGSSMGGMMCCNTYTNINNGQRDVLGTYAEWEHRLTQQWSSLIGLRNDVTWMNTGDVQGYSSMYDMDAAAFNAQNHARTFVNWDVTALLRYNPDASSQYEFGYTRKSRAPSIYELYSWSTNPMAASMIGWFGDGNGYVGNLNLQPETANTVAATAHWTDPSQKVWDVKLTPYYSYVQNYIDVNQIGVIGMGPNAVNLLQFANHDAQLAGVDLSGRALIAQTAQYGDFSIFGNLSYTRGWLNYNGSSLYHIMPVNGKIALENALPLLGGRLVSTLEVQAAAAKSQVEAVRLEPTTPSYAVVNLRESFTYQNLRFDLGLENLANQQYYNPLGGINIANYTAGTDSLLHTPVSAIGRMVYGGVTVKF